MGNKLIREFSQLMKRTFKIHCFGRHVFSIKVKHYTIFSCQDQASQVLRIFVRHFKKIQWTSSITKPLTKTRQ